MRGLAKHQTAYNQGEAGLRVRFGFAEEPNPDDNGVSFTAVSLAFLELQRLWVYLAYLGEPDPVAGEPSQDFDAFLANPANWILTVESIRYESPLRIESTYPGGPRTLNAILQVIVRILTVDLIRERAKWDVELARQKAEHEKQKAKLARQKVIAAALKNEDEILKISKRMPLAKRDGFRRSMTRSIDALSAGSLRLAEIEASEESVGRFRQK